MILGISRRRKRPPVDTLVHVRLRLFDERGMRFAKLRDARVLIYWPHGFGDFAHLGYLLPLLEPSNQYWIARYGDDFSELYRGNRYAEMLPSGVQSTDNAFGNSARDFHLGVRYGSAAGKMVTLSLTPALAAAVQAQGIDTVLWTDYPDANGTLHFPYHTKIRSLAQQLIIPERLALFDFTKRLPYALPFDAIDNEAQAYVNHRLHETFGSFSQLCLIQSGGHTAAHKRWEDAEVLAFAKRYCSEYTERAVVLLNDVAMSDRVTLPRIATWRGLFAQLPEEPSMVGEQLAYARLIRALLARTTLMVGVPAGPTHLASALGAITTIALWRAHHPFAYEEPNAKAVHVLSTSVFQERSKQWMLAKTIPPDYLGTLICLPVASIPYTSVYELTTGADVAG